MASDSVVFLRESRPSLVLQALPENAVARFDLLNTRPIRRLALCFGMALLLTQMLRSEELRELLFPIRAYVVLRLRLSPRKLIDQGGRRRVALEAPVEQLVRW
jgi:hypothetical protein